MDIVDIIFIEILARASRHGRYSSLPAAGKQVSRSSRVLPSGLVRIFLIPLLWDSSAQIQNHQLNWWFAHTLEGFIAGVPVNGYRNLATHHYLGQPLCRGCLFLPYLFLIPVNGSMYSLILIWSCIWSSSNCFFIYSLITRSFRPTVST